MKTTIGDKRLFVTFLMHRWRCKFAIEDRGTARWYALWFGPMFASLKVGRNEDE